MIEYFSQKIKYPKLSLLFLIYSLTIILLNRNSVYIHLQKVLLPLGALGVLFGGFFYAYSFTAAPATVALLALAKQCNYISAGIIGGLGALLSDILIFLFIKHSFIIEIDLLKKEKIMVLVAHSLKKMFGIFYAFLLPVIACIFIALLGTIKKLSIKSFLIVVYILHTAGIFIILSIGSCL